MGLFCAPAAAATAAAHLHMFLSQALLLFLQNVASSPRTPRTSFSMVFSSDCEFGWTVISLFGEIEVRESVVDTFECHLASNI